MSERDEFEEWIFKGYDAGWISDVQCVIHDGIPMTDEEMEQSWEDDVCYPMVRVFALERVLPWEN